VLERRRTADSIGLELAALRIEHELQSNLIVRLTDALYAKPNERRLIELLQAWQTEVAEWAASVQPPEPS
jgi:hypothetical protein